MSSEDVMNDIDGVDEPKPVASAPSKDVAVAADGKAVESADAGNEAVSKGIRIIDQVKPELAVKIRSASKSLLSEFVDNRNKLDSFGVDTLKEVNGVVEEELHNPTNYDSKQINDLIRSMTGEFKETVQTYDESSIEGKLDKKAKGISAWFRNRKLEHERKRFDSKSLLDRFKYVETKLTEQKSVMETNISFGYSMMDGNKKAARKLINRIAMIEAVRDDAVADEKELEAEQSKLPETDIRYHEIGDRITAMAGIIHNLDAKHTEYLEALFEAYSTNAQLVNTIAISQGLRDKTDRILNFTIKSMKKVIVQIGINMQAQETAKLDSDIEDATEAAREMQRRTAVEGTKYIAAVSEAPDVSKESIMASAKSIIDQNDAYINALEEGRRKRLEAEQATVDGMKMISQSMREKDSRTIKAVLGEVDATQSVESAPSADNRPIMDEIDAASATDSSTGSDATAK